MDLKHQPASSLQIARKAVLPWVAPSMMGAILECNVCRQAMHACMRHHKGACLQADSKTCGLGQGLQTTSCPAVGPPTCACAVCAAILHRGCAAQVASLNCSSTQKHCQQRQRQRSRQQWPRLCHRLDAAAAAAGVGLASEMPWRRPVTQKEVQISMQTRICDALGCMRTIRAGYGGAGNPGHASA